MIVKLEIKHGGSKYYSNTSTLEKVDSSNKCDIV